MVDSQAAPAGVATAALASKKRRSYRVVRRHEVSLEHNGYRLWRSISMVIENALESVSIRPDVQRRLWSFMAAILAQHSAPALWGRPIALSKHSKLLLSRLGFTANELETVKEKALLVGLIQRIDEPLQRKSGSVEYEPYHYLFGPSIRAALQKIFAYLARRFKSAEYIGKFSLGLGSRESSSTTKIEDNRPIHPAELAISPKIVEPIDLSTFEPPLADALEELGGKTCQPGNLPWRSVAPAPAPAPKPEPPKPIVVKAMAALSGAARAIFDRLPLDPTPAPTSARLAACSSTPLPKAWPTSPPRQRGWATINEADVSCDDRINAAMARVKHAVGS